MKKVIKIWLTLAVALAVTLAVPTQAETFLARGNLKIGSNVNYGGALTYLSYKGSPNLVNMPLYYTGAEDHGRQIQSAVWFDDYGECLNPTQGGSDPRMTTVRSSLTRSTYVSGDTIFTAAEMGYWLQPGFNYGKACGTHTDVTHAVNTTVRSKTLLNANYTLGYGNIPDVLTVNTTFNVAEFHYRAAFEMVTFFTSLDFNRAEYIKMSTGQLIPATSRYEQNDPVIMYNADESIAIGLYSRDSGMRYTWSTGVDSAHEACYFRTTNVKAGQAVKKQCQFVFGTKTEVEATMIALKALN